MSRKHTLGIAVTVTLLAVASSCGSPAPAGVSVGAAANLTEVLNEIARSFRQSTGIPVKVSYGSTAQIARQIDNGAPFDVFAAADTEHVDELIRKGRLDARTRSVYARGILALWAPHGDELGIHSIRDLTKPAIRFIAVAQPDAAPYGKAAVETLQALKLWESLRPKVVYANNINTAKQYAGSGNAEAAFTAYSLVIQERGSIVRVDGSLHAPLDQALAVSTSSRCPLARRFTAFVLGAAGRDILRRGGYILP